MKQFILTVFTAVFMLFFFEGTAQEKKVKVKDDKVKVKDGDKKVKAEGNETKIKEGDSKVKVEGNEVKTKEGDNKVKMDGNELKVKTDSLKLKAEGVTMTDFPYRADYSSQFMIGNPAHGRRILELWKDYDDNAFQRHTDYYADSLMVILSDGQTIRGRDSALAGVTRYRGGLTNVKSTVDAWIPLKSIDRNEDWVAIWGTETATDNQGRTTTTAIHEIWAFNKDGKVNFLRQYTAQIPKQ